VDYKKLQEVFFINLKMEKKENQRKKEGGAELGLNFDHILEISSKNHVLQVTLAPGW
jgi:hypothetical protein